MKPGTKIELRALRAAGPVNWLSTGAEPLPLREIWISAEVEEDRGSEFVARYTDIDTRRPGLALVSVEPRGDEPRAWRYPDPDRRN